MAEAMKVRQVFDDLGEFVETYKARISREGMLLETDVEYRPGTRLEVELRLSDDLALISGSAEVLGAAEGAPGALLLRFLSLDRHSVELLDRLERRVVAEGDTPFRLAAGSGAGRSRAESSTGGPPAKGRAAVEDDPNRTRELHDMVAAALGEGEGRAGQPPDIRRPRPPQTGEPEVVEGRGLTLGRAAAVAGLVLVIGAALCVGVFLMRREMTRAPEVVEVAEAVATPVPAEEQTPVPATAAVTPASVAVGETPAGSSPVTARAEERERPTPVPARPSPAAAVAPSPATRITDIGWREEDGSTVITLVADGELGRSRIHDFRLGDPPRHAIQVRGVAEPYPSLRIDVNDQRVERIRTWHHAELQPPELHVVLDLAGAGVTVSSLRAAGSRVVVTVTRSQ